MLEVKNLSFKFEVKNPFLFEDINLSLKDGEILSILGRNGIGKTTLLKCILGLYANYTGHIDKVKSIGYVPQKVFVTFDMPVLEMIVMGRIAYLGFFGMPQKKDYDIARQKAEQLGISNLLDKSFMNLSGGQKQMVLIARALCLEPQMIIFDEPMSALDYNNQNHILQIIKEIADEGVTVIFTTHDPTHAVHVSNKSLLLKTSDKHFFGLTTDILVDHILEEVYEMPLTLHKLRDNNIVTPIFSSC